MSHTDVVEQLLAAAPIRNDEPGAVTRARDILSLACRDACHADFGVRQRTAMATLENHVRKSTPWPTSRQATS